MGDLSDAEQVGCRLLDLGGHGTISIGEAPGDGHRDTTLVANRLGHPDAVNGMVRGRAEDDSDLASGQVSGL